MNNIYNVDFNRWGYVEDNGYIPRNGCGVTMETVKEVVSEMIDEITYPEIEERDDKLYVGDKEVMTDKYVKSGTYSEDGTVTLQLSDDKTATIENLPQPMSEDDVKNIMDKE